MGLGLFSSSCASVGYVQKTEYEIAPNQNFPKNIQYIYLLNRSREKNQLKRAVKSISSGYIVGDELSNARRVLMNKLSREYYREAKYIGEDKKGQGDRAADRISMADLEEKRGQSDGMLCLEQYSIDEQRSYENIEKHQLDAKGNDVYLQAIHGYKEVKLTTYWRLYDSKSGVILSEFPRELVKICEAEAFDIPSLNTKLDTVDIITAESLSISLAKEMLVDLNPTYIKSKWMYYKKGNGIIKESGKLIKEGRYSKAISIIEDSDILINSDDELRYKVYHNLSVAYYLKSDIDTALKVAKDGYKYTKETKLNTLAGRMKRE